MMVTEIELKYLLLDNEAQATMEQVKATIELLLNNSETNFSYQQKVLTNRYFDTPKLLFRQHRIALRSRGTKFENNECFEQTIKTSGKVIAGLHQRPEYNIDIDNNEPILSFFPDAIWPEEIDVNQLQQEIVELFSTNFTRHTWLITLANGQVELAFDSGTIACKDFSQTPNIYEIELELVSGDTEALFFVTQILFSKLALRPGQLTKAARGYALFHQSQSQASMIENELTHFKESPKKSAYYRKNEAVKQAAFFTMPLSKSMSIDQAFKAGIGFCLSQLQLNVDNYVAEPSLSKLGKINEILRLIRQGLWLFSPLLSDEDSKLRDELSYYIRTMHWVDNAHYIQALINKQSTYQKESAVTQKIITKLELDKKSYPCELEVLSLLHCESFNNLQLALLGLLLREESLQSDNITTEQKLVDFACTELKQSFSLLTNSLLSPEGLTSKEYYFKAHSLLTRALLTQHWFSSLFIEQGSKLINNFNMPWLDIKQGVSELQSIELLKQQLEQLPEPEHKLIDWLITKNDNLLAALDQSRVKGLSMKCYWC